VTGPGSLVRGLAAVALGTAAGLAVAIADAASPAGVPLIGSDFADPTIMRASDGWFYAFSTEQLTTERMANIQAARSRDLVRWELLPDAMPAKPARASKTRDFWAPGAIESGERATCTSPRCTIRAAGCA